MVGQLASYELPPERASVRRVSNDNHKPAKQIPFEMFETYLMLIRSEQIPFEDVPKLLEANPELARWYNELIKSAR